MYDIVTVYCMPRQSKMWTHKTQPKDGETMDDVANYCCKLRGKNDLYDGEFLQLLQCVLYYRAVFFRPRERRLSAKGIS